MSAAVSGVLLVDKPAGPTSHDVVSWARKVFGTRTVGHAGTLDPAATGVLVVLVREATKLSTWLTSEQKEYVATVRFHIETDSLDADGAVTRTMVVPPTITEAQLRAELASMVGVMEQVPPAVSAIKLQGVAAHERVRRGEQLVMAPRTVELLSTELLWLSEDSSTCSVRLLCSKGFYVRAFARDFADRLHTVAHLTQLRRTQSGVFTLAHCVDGELLRRAAREDPTLRAELHAKLLSIEALATELHLASVTVDSAAAKALRQGKSVLLSSDSMCAIEWGLVVLVLEREGLAVGLAERVQPPSVSSDSTNGEDAPKSLAESGPRAQPVWIKAVRNFAYEPIASED
jgi:tRNA pseudouridine55 synthase